MLSQTGRARPFAYTVYPLVETGKAKLAREVCRKEIASLYLGIQGIIAYGFESTRFTL